MTHNRSKSVSSIDGELPKASDSSPLSISIPRKRSMSISFGIPTSPLSYSGPSIVSSSLGTNQQNNADITSPSSFGGFTGRRFSSGFTNPLTNPFNGSNNNSQAEARRKSSFFGSSPPLSHPPVHPGDQTEFPKPVVKDNTSGGIGGLFRKIRQGSGHPFDTNEIGPLPNHPESNNNQNTPQVYPQHHLSTIDEIKRDTIPRSASPMGNMMLNGQMLD